MVRDCNGGFIVRVYFINTINYFVIFFLIIIFYTYIRVFEELKPVDLFF